jgi:hypothetical protein
MEGSAGLVWRVQQVWCGGFSRFKMEGSAGLVWSVQQVQNELFRRFIVTDANSVLTANKEHEM